MRKVQSLEMHSKEVLESSMFSLISHSIANIED